MIDIALKPMANQELSIALEGARYILRVIEITNGMAITITRDDEVLIENQRLLPNVPIMEERHLQGFGGNFMLTTQDEEIPYYTSFDVTQFLVYITAEELAAVDGNGT